MTSRAYYIHGSDRGVPKRLPSISSMPSCNRIGASEVILQLGRQASSVSCSRNIGASRHYISASTCIRRLQPKRVGGWGSAEACLKTVYLGERHTRARLAWQASISGKVTKEKRGLQIWLPLSFLQRVANQSLVCRAMEWHCRKRKEGSGCSCSVHQTRIVVFVRDPVENNIVAFARPSNWFTNT
ncbi:uncharacterized protein BO96DRAFT_243413 [Aspergillus niger CBS 101883]|uniref:uncharacterized protein n=1 Tax=Aspergillus lacticoffeatus (strain CBS 101883) TaxID=1450533 RepID=UPI000D7F7B05|nr:uncharacterized protein BO96DRAFT_243413 [Aspergillus niger CBS 101883]PYH58490.1 hypothetical protein BO96DRAFT_243413 [Aspergillus niger CBS 101883]